MVKHAQGVEALWVNGERFAVKEGASFNPGTLMREGIVGADAVHGYTEKPQQPYIEVPITRTQGTQVRRLVESLNGEATITLRMRNGDQAVLSNAWAAGDWNINVDDGQITARFEGLACEEIAA